MELLEKTLDSEEKYRGVIVTVTLDHAQLCDGRTVLREVVHHPGGVSVLPVDDEGFCYMVRQFRYPAGEQMLEIPAGKREKGEEPLACAVRELSEETGFTADRLVDLGRVYPTPGYDNEVIYIYLATGLHPGKSHPDDGEFLNVEKIHLDELTDMAMRGELIDAKSIIAVLKAKRFLEAEDRKN